MTVYAVLTKVLLIKTNIRFYLLIYMYYDISTGLFDTNMKRLYMCAKPGRHGWPSRKSRTANSILFMKENVFCTTFQSAVDWSACGLAYV